MHLTLDRFSPDKNDTLGKLYIDGAFVCYTLEDEERKVKVPGDTCIPKGTYAIRLRKEGQHNEQYAKRFPKMHIGMLWLQNVPGFQYILIHCGNTDADTKGCILVGSQIGPSTAGKRSIIGSAIAYQKIYPSIATALQHGENVTIEIK